MGRLADLIPGELEYSEYNWLISPYRHLGFLTRRRANTIVNRVRLLAFLFAILTVLWSGIDLAVFPSDLWLKLALIRLVSSAAFASVLLYSPTNGSLISAYRAMAQLFAIPAIFFVASYMLLGHYRLVGLSAAISVGYAFLPFILMAGLSIFPLTLLETLMFSTPILIAQLLAGLLRWVGMDWPSFAGEFWLLVLISGVSVLAGMSQLGFMIGLVRQAVRDALTGVFSRSGGEEVLELQFSIAARSGAKLSVAFLDLDHFKSINDQYGHEAGDTVLVNMASIVSRHLRRSDVLVRWGGEEFLVIMPDTSLAHAEAALVRLLKTGFGVTPRNTPVTASIGVAELMIDKARDWKSLLEIADQRMYRAKQNGRDQICGRDEKVTTARRKLAAH